MSQSSDHHAYRKALSQFATGVTVITTLDQQGEKLGITVSSFNSVSLDPPLILWSLSRHVSRYTDFMVATNFVVNVLRQDEEYLSRRFARTIPDMWADIAVSTSALGLPQLSTAIAHFECRTAHRYEGGDHLIIVGEVLNFAFDPTARPLIYHQSGYHSLK